jgi:hypothetical protein
MINIETLQGIIQRWKNHIGFLDVIKKSNIDKEKIEDWEKRIHFTFKNLLKSKL